MGGTFYFHSETDHAELDAEGTELRDLEQARREALVLFGSMLLHAKGASLWNGKPWKVWVSDGPNGNGHVLFTLQVSVIEY